MSEGLGERSKALRCAHSSMDIRFSTREALRVAASLSVNQVRYGARLVIQLVVGHKVMEHALAATQVFCVEVHAGFAGDLGAVDAGVGGARLVAEAAPRTAHSYPTGGRHGLAGVQFGGHEGLLRVGVAVHGQLLLGRQVPVEGPGGLGVLLRAAARAGVHGVAGRA